MHSGRPPTIKNFRLDEMGCRSSKPEFEVDPEQYAGVWYELAKTTFFGIDCSNSVTVYRYTVGIGFTLLNCCYRNGKVIRSVQGSARLVNGCHMLVKTNFDKPSRQVIEWTDYQTVSFVSSDDRRQLWILTRDPYVTRVRLQSIKEKARLLGFNPDRLQYNF